MMSMPQDRYSRDSASVENCGPSMHTYVPPLVDCRAGRAGRRERDVTQRPAERMGETHMGDEAVAEEGRHASLRSIEELIRDHEVERFVLFLETPHRARREDVLDAKQLEAVDVRAEIELGREQPVPRAMTREEGDALAAERSEHVRRGRRPERCLDAALFPIGELRHVVQAAAADDANRRRHVQ